MGVQVWNVRAGLPTKDKKWWLNSISADTDCSFLTKIIKYTIKILFKIEDKSQPLEKRVFGCPLLLILWNSTAPYSYMSFQWDIANCLKKTYLSL